MNKNDEWYTPPEIVDKVHEVLGEIDLDPASNEIANEGVCAENIFTIEDDALTKEWFGRVFLNPPYSAALIKKFTEKALEEYESGRVKEMIILTNSGTDTQWNIPLSKGLQGYTIGRISFLQPDGTRKGKGGRGQLFTYFGDNKEKFIEEFSDICWFPNIGVL